MKALNLRGWLGCILATSILFLSCRQGEPVEKKRSQAKKLPDLNIVFEDYEHLENRGKYDLLARKIYEANSDLQSSELYVEAASLYLQADNKDSAVYLLHRAIDMGMANPGILGKLPGLEGMETEEFSRLESRLDSLGKVLSNIDNFSVETRAMDTFWPYFEKALAEKDSARNYLKAFILEGPPEIRDYYAIRYYNTENMYGQMINGAPEYYTYLRNRMNPDSLAALRGKTTAALKNFKTLYPKAVFPKVYIVPGLLNSGGTASEMGLFVGGDMYGRSPSMPEHELNEWQNETISDLKALPQLILHELMHYQQSYSDSLHGTTVMYKVIGEGVCDFLRELASGTPVESEQLDYLKIPENFRMVTLQLKQDLLSEDLSLWLYNGGSIEDRPADLGYAMGYLITKSYYENAVDKKTALFNLLNTDDMRSILRGSDYHYLLDKDPEF
ncbi:DUF2268 domain-containing putative Zn-dependent protease [Muriicola marianensis]|uniref:DUF2268 domain-containing protein n=1 Tax=Muriicola marianensis TaxID=1324801 RepID=A0ABQ1R7G1_9FLAO|nr:DUF2268 domain-containing putative Zn-dependent protease [Muriicola marianensis]GGD58749.1 hypothetical protein GCM10011361_26400 [Muriicola marianensis]